MARKCGPSSRSLRLYFKVSDYLNWMAHTPVGHDNKGAGMGNTYFVTGICKVIINKPCTSVYWCGVLAGTMM